MKILIALLLIPSFAIADIGLVLGSKHFGDEYNYSYREFNPGISYEGCERFCTVLSIYRNSINKTSVYAAKGYHLFDTEKFSIGVEAGIVSGYDYYVAGGIYVNYKRGNHRIKVIAAPAKALGVANSNVVGLQYYYMGF